ncbi:Starch-binding associating with outer membrane [Epilithonimonas zeae]|uniref:Starch-binding associating with outer membrane n=2 Tax=Epilithonimonas zeae TaxID=1416779 RepID=A0A1N6DY55_9FLAO|nr:SusD/RagB family nutrient-binding outer membrane lipoprotein [Epilithonimonas zeae]SIN75682.1 Starch-binding associating with outer membrane [Epilithonimonas zeae]
MALSATLLSSISCNDFLDTNIDPDRADANLLTPNYIFPGAVTGGSVFSATAGSYVQARVLNAFASLQMNSLAGNSYSFGTPFVDDYTPNITSGYNSAIWDAMFRQITNFQTIIDYNDPNGQYKQFKAMSMIMKAYHVQILTDLYGDMPYTEAFKRELNLSPKYDKGEDIYKASIADLESAVQLINSGTGANPGSADVVFGGTMPSWIAFANTIKLRYLIRMSNVTGEMATYRDQKLATLAGATFSASNVTMNPGYSSTSDSKQNPWTNYWVVLSSGARPVSGNQSYTLYTASEHIALALNGNKRYIPTSATTSVEYNDPRDVYQKFNGIKDGRSGRLFTLITPAGRDATEATVEGVRQGATPGQAGAEAGRTGNTVSRFGLGLIVGNNTTITSTAPADIVAAASAKPVVLLSKAETEFLLAEAALRYPAVFGNDKGHFEAGITASYSYLGATGAAAYITSINAVPKLGWTGSNDNKLEAIMTQKWIALTGINPEQSFFDYTRTGYPITPMATIATGTVKPNRLIYPTSEYASNANNVPNMTATDVFTKNQFTPFWAR